jgi:cell division protein FtsI (penicillin-binding protein 3)
MAEIMMSGAVRAAAVLAIGLLVYVAMARASAAARRAVLVAALGAAMVVPVAAAVAPAWRVETPAALGVFGQESPMEGAAVGDSPAAAGAAAQQGPTAVPTAQRGGLDWASVLLAVWLLGATALLARAAVSQVRARRLARTGDCLELGGGVAVRICDGVDSPAVTGLLSPTVLLPRSAAGWSAARTQIVLTHELAHVARRDGLAQLVADAACAVHWFNPLAWLAASRLRIERELAADDAVLSSGVRASSYAEELLAVAGAATAGALAMAERTTLGTRVVAILAARRARGPLAARGTAVLVAGSLAVGAAVACAAPHAPQRNIEPSRGTDATAQAAAEDVLASLRKEQSPQGAVVVILDAATGQILANAGDIGAITPGSTLKPVTIAAALDAGAITATQQFDCGPEPRHYGDQVLRDASPNGALDAAHILAVSSNIGTSHIFDALGGDRMAAALTRFHFTAPPRLETGTREGALVAIGELSTATPLQMAAAYAALASDGVYHAPASKASSGERVISSATAAQIMAMLDTAVSDPDATGKRAKVDGIHVAGKTGTADFKDAAGHEHTYASFIGIADLPRGRVVALVGVDTLRTDVSGGSIAAPAFARLISRLR